MFQDTPPRHLCHSHGSPTPLPGRNSSVNRSFLPGFIHLWFNHIIICPVSTSSRISGLTIFIWNNGKLPHAFYPKMHLHILFFFAFILMTSHGYPRKPSLFPHKDLKRRDASAITEWTAMGDSYASGIGAGPQNPNEEYFGCFRFPLAYPPTLQSGDGSLQPNPLTWNNVACSGNTFQEIMDKEFLDQPLNDGRFGVRPVWGQAPEFATITMGGNDVGIQALVLACILDLNLFGADCDQQIINSQATIDSDDFSSGARAVIQTAINKGRATIIGPEFYFFVTGYAQFFNQETTQCNTVNFKPSWNPAAGVPLTIERRTAMNQLALNLNAALKAAVDSFATNQNVVYVDYDSQFEGHRFCDRDEPNPQDPDTWFFHYYTTDATEDTAIEGFFEQLPAYTTTISNNSTPSGLFTNDLDYISALLAAAGDDPTSQGYLSDTFRVMHPTAAGHQVIRDALLNAIDAAGIPEPNVASIPQNSTSASVPLIATSAAQISTTAVAPLVATPTPAGLSPQQQECDTRCPPGTSLTSSNGQWCLANCGCFLDASGC